MLSYRSRWFNLGFFRDEPEDYCASKSLHANWVDRAAVNRFLFRAPCRGQCILDSAE
jgi:hypothetical protein